MTELVTNEVRMLQGKHHVFVVVLLHVAGRITTPVVSRMSTTELVPLAYHFS